MHRNAIKIFVVLGIIFNVPNGIDKEKSSNDIQL